MLMLLCMTRAMLTSSNNNMSVFPVYRTLGWDVIFQLRPLMNEKASCCIYANLARSLMLAKPSSISRLLKTCDDLRKRWMSKI